MEREFDFGGTDFEARAVSPFREMGVCETLWSERDATFKSLAERFVQRPAACLQTSFPDRRLTSAPSSSSGGSSRSSGSACGSMAPASTPSGCEMPPIPSSCSTTKAGGTWRTRARSQWWVPESRRARAASSAPRARTPFMTWKFVRARRRSRPLQHRPDVDGACAAPRRGGRNVHRPAGAGYRRS